MDVLIELHTEWLYDPKTASNAALAVVSIITASFIFLDLARHHLMPQRWRRAMFFLAVFFMMCFISGVTRFYDSLVDLAYIHQHPELLLTPSLTSAWLTSWPTVAMSLMMFLFLIYLNIAYYHKSKPTNNRTVYPPN